MRQLPRAGSLLRRLGLRIPLLMVALLAASLAIMGWLGHHRVNRFAAEAERSRLEATTNQLIATFGATLGRVRSDLARLAAHPATRAATSATASARRRDEAIGELARYRASSAQFLAIALWSDDGRLIASDGDEGLIRASPPIHGRPSEDVDSMIVVSPLSRRGDTLLYTATAPITRDRRVTGHLVATRRIVSSSEGGALYGNLIGPHARIMFGNAGDRHTIDLAFGKGVEMPQGDAAGEYTPADGTPRFYAVAAIPNTPWRLLVDEPRHLVLAPAERFAMGMLGVAAIFIVIAGTVTWVVIRRALRPLADVTQAVVGFAGGGLAERVSVTGGEEVAQLGAAFNSMADRVASRTDALLESVNQHQETERRYRALIDHLPDGIMVHRGYVIALVNPACARLFGERDPEALIGRSILDFIEPAEHQLTVERLEQVRGGGRVPTREVRLRRADGMHVVVESTNLPLLLDGVPAIQTILHDVTERHAMEDRLRQAQKMEAVGRLAGGIAHDFNNILTVIDAHADFALHRVAVDPAAAQDIDEIRRASASAARLTRQLLAFSRKQAAAPTAIDLNDSVREVMVMLRRLIGDGIEMDARLEPSPWMVFADASHFEQVLLNLAINARDAMPLGGRLTFATRNDLVGANDRSATGELIKVGDYVTLTVADTGTGMTPEVASRVFEPFFTTKGAGRGTGLGLSMVYGIVKQAGGYIWVFTEPGVGTTFKVMLPRHVANGEARSSSTASTGPTPAISASVLLVEDQPAVRAAVARALRAAGLTVTDARDATAALRVLEETTAIDIVITDMMMPGMSGAELAAVLSATRPDLPIIIMSGYSEDLANGQWQLPENARFLEKPINVRRLMEVVGEQLGAAPATSPSIRGAT
jgi:PAS domain S-box-containing protein